MTGRRHAPIKLAEIATSSGKVTKSEADYVNYSRQRHCEDCTMFRPPGECTKVAGSISMVGTCRFWDAKSRLPTTL